MPKSERRGRSRLVRKGRKKAAPVPGLTNHGAADEDSSSAAAAAAAAAAAGVNSLPDLSLPDDLVQLDQVIQKADTKTRRPEQLVHVQTSTPAQMVKRVFGQLESKTAHMREAACHAISQYLTSASPDVVRQLFKANVVSELITRLLDRELRVCTAAAGALRNAAIVGESLNASELMTKQDIITAIFSTLEKPAPSHATMRSQYHQLVEHMLYLLTVLGETHDVVVSRFTDNHVKLFPIVLNFISPRLPTSLSIAAGK
jgi:Armadillo/beta-catenin-like repeat